MSLLPPGEPDEVVTRPLGHMQGAIPASDQRVKHPAECLVQNAVLIRVGGEIRHAVYDLIGFLDGGEDFVLSHFFVLLSFDKSILARIHRLVKHFLKILARIFTSLQVSFHL